LAIQYVCMFTCFYSLILLSHRWQDNRRWIKCPPVLMGMQHGISSLILLFLVYQHHHLPASFSPFLPFSFLHPCLLHSPLFPSLSIVHTKQINEGPRISLACTIPDFKVWNSMPLHQLIN
jgi:hypothetical protein